MITRRDALACCEAPHMLHLVQRSGFTSSPLAPDEGLYFRSWCRSSTGKCTFSKTESANRAFS